MVDVLDDHLELHLMAYEVAWNELKSIEKQNSPEQERHQGIQLPQTREPAPCALSSQRDGLQDPAAGSDSRRALSYEERPNGNCCYLGPGGAGSVSERRNQA